MKNKVVISGITILLVCIFCITAYAGAVLSPAVSILQKDTQVIKTCVGGDNVYFEAEDFEKVLNVKKIKELTVVALPDVACGVLKLGYGDVTPGQSIPRGYISSLRFIPNENVQSASFTFTADGMSECTCKLVMLDTLNSSPTAKECALYSVSGVCVYGKLAATDPENDALVYTVTSGPRHGTLTLDKHTGEYKYSPDMTYSGRDRFTFRVTDVYANTSESANVTIDIDKNTGNILYADMLDSGDHLAAVMMAQNGIIVGEKLGDDRLFYPERTVTRGEFLIMAMNAAGITPEENADVSAFADSGSFTQYLSKYVGTAYKLGIIKGFTQEDGTYFKADSVINAEQAATVTCRICRKLNAPFSGELAVSAYTDMISEQDLSVLVSAGICADVPRDTEMTRANIATALYAMMNSIN